MNSTEKIYSVSELNRAAAGRLEESFRDITLEGEISAVKVHSSGHMYFTLKDPKASIDAVMFSSRRALLGFIPRRGIKVLLRGTVTVYSKTGRYQVVARIMREMGEGELEAEFLRLRKRLLEEGLFDEKIKKPLPPVPRLIGIVTSLSGAALRDIINVLERRAVSLEVIIFPVTVQGGAASGEISRALGILNRLYPDMDALILGRGGGSLEDLWAFNEEKTARAVFDSVIPVISAVGHETDFTITDFAADLRAPTPSAAAELVTEDALTLKKRLRRLSMMIANSMRSILELQEARISGILELPVFRYPFKYYSELQQDIDGVFERLSVSVKHRLELLGHRLGTVSGTLEPLSPELTLKRGYSITLRGGEAVKSASQLREGDILETVFCRGKAGSRVIECRKEEK